MVQKLLIANRGEIACRIIRAARKLSLPTVAVYSAADSALPHVAQADESVLLGPAPARESYLNQEAVIEAARRTGATLVHPGYGFLSERASFAQSCASAGLTFVGPSADVIRLMGDKNSAREAAARARVPVLPGSGKLDISDAGAIAAAVSVAGLSLIAEPISGMLYAGSVAAPAWLLGAFTATPLERYLPKRFSARFSTTGSYPTLGAIVTLACVIGMLGAAGAGLVGLFFIQPHFRNRIMGFIQPDADSAYQVNAAKAAIANGGIWGKGLNEGVMKRHIPDLHTDFIYSVVAEEYGLWMTLLIIGIFGFIVVRGLIKAMAMQDPFRQIATCGLYIMLGMQVLINISVNLGLIPPKGMTLPFISYGGSSMLAMGLCLGFILALTRKRNDEIVINDDPSHW